MARLSEVRSSHSSRDYSPPSYSPPPVYLPPINFDLDDGEANRTLLWIVLGAVAVVAAIAFGIYYFFF